MPKLPARASTRLQASLDQLKTQAAMNNEDDVQLRELERDAKSQRDLLDSYLAKYREASARDAVNASPPDARVISRATVSNVPAYPKKLPTVLIAILTTLMMSSGLCADQGAAGCAGERWRVYAAPPLAARRGRTSGRSAPSRMAAALDVPQEISAGGQTDLSRAVDRCIASGPTGAGLSDRRTSTAHRISAIDDVADDLRHNGSAGAPVAIFGSAQGLDASWTALKFARMLAKRQ